MLLGVCFPAAVWVCKGNSPSESAIELTMFQRAVGAETYAIPNWTPVEDCGPVYYSPNTKNTKWEKNSVVVRILRVAEALPGALKLL